MLHENFITTHTASHADARQALIRRCRALLSSRRTLVLLTVSVALTSLLWASVERPPRVWAVSEVPIAFWAWRADAPTAADIETVRAATNADTLFLRAGQIDYADGKFTRIRSVEGAPPAGIETHLVYNATEATLERFATLDTETLALFIAATYLNDAEHARARGAHIRGLQLDLDAPTRLLNAYAEILLHLRRRLPQSTQLSITGLPTWMDAPALKRTLAATDFWIPQFYGDHVPRTLTDRTPIADAAALTRDLTRARRLAHPFHAGLPAYGYALLYSPRGSLIALRGDIPPALVARDQRLRLVTRQPVGSTDNATTTTTSNSSSTPDFSSAPTAWRYDFLATADAAINGLNIRVGEHLLLEIPTAVGLRLMAQLTRQHGGTHLRGICLFRLPTATDPTTLTTREIAYALADRTPHPETALQLHRAQNSLPQDSDTNRAPNGEQTLFLTAENKGAAASVIGDKTFTVTLRIPAGSLRAVADLQGFTTSETLCSESARAEAMPGAFGRPCSARRADTVRFSAPTWEVGARARGRLIVGENFPELVSSATSLTSEIGETHRQSERIVVTFSDGVPNHNLQERPRQ